MKRCCRCKEEKEGPSFHKNKGRPDGLNDMCKLCRKKDPKAKAWGKVYSKMHKAVRNARALAWHKDNKEVSNTRAIDWYNANKEEVNKRRRILYLNDPYKYSERNKLWVQNNMDRCAAKTAKYRASKLQRTPPWLTNEDFSVMRAFYRVAKKLTEVTGEPYHVDHIIPLQGELVSGLHVPTNLQVIKGVDNLSKGNRINLEEFNRCQLY